jgi:hypothetical protein
LHVVPFAAAEQPLALDPSATIVGGCTLFAMPLTLTSVKAMEPVFGEADAGRFVFAEAPVAAGIAIENVTLSAPEVGVVPDEGEEAGANELLPPPHALTVASAITAIHFLFIGESPP